MVIIFLPLLNTILIGAFSHYLGVLGINCLIILSFSVNFILTWANFVHMFTYNSIINYNIGSWFTFYNLSINWEFQSTLISSLLAVIVVSISFLIHIYSMYYMDNDVNYQKFVMLLSLFTFFMLFLISSSHLITLLVGWEGVGICSFLLINFWSTRQEATQSAIKAVLFNKIGDLAFILGVLTSLQIIINTDLIFLNITLLNYCNFNIIFNITILQVIAYSFVIAAFGKSAQFFFHLWLTDAMEGPTPVSGLIHSATMVIAGIFLIIQIFPIIKLSSEILLIIMLVGTSSTLITSLIATTSFDFKRIVANSTASHIGLMFMSLGLGDLSISLFHLTTHAYFKAFGFLFAGYLIHILNNEQDCRFMGGFFNLLPIISILEEYWCITMLNLPNSSSYYSKELFFNSFWAYNQIFITSFIIYSSFFLCFLSFICSSLYIGYLLSWLGDKTTIKKLHVKNIYETKWLPLFILLFLALSSQLLGYLIFNLFYSQNAFFTFNNVSIFYFIADWSELQLIYSSLAIIFITILIDFIEDFNKLFFPPQQISFFFLIFLFLISKNFTLSFLLVIIILIGIYISFNKHDVKLFTYLINRVTSFSLDTLLNNSLYNTNIKGFNLFISIDNYILETANYINFYKKVSYFFQKIIFNKFIIQININLMLVILFIIFLNYII